MSASISLGPVITKQVLAFESLSRSPNIVERPSAGYVMVPPAIGSLIGDAVKCMLEKSQDRGSTRAYLRCAIDHHRLLRLEILDDGGRYGVPEQWALSEIAEQAGKLAPGSVLGITFGPQHAAYLAIPLAYPS